MRNLQILNAFLAILALAGVTYNFHRQKSSLSEDQIRTIISTELSRASFLSEQNPEQSTVQKTSSVSPEISRKNVEEAIAKQVAARLEGVNWEELIGSEKLGRALVRGATRELQGADLPLKVDVSNIPDMPGRVQRVLAEFEGMNSYTNNNSLVQQLKSFGRDAIEPLLQELQQTEASADNWPKRSAVNDALHQLLGPQDKEIILKTYERNGELLDLIGRYRISEAEESIMSSVAKNPSNLSGDLAVAAVQLNPEKAVPILDQTLENGTSYSAALGALSTVPGIDLSSRVLVASRKAVAPGTPIWEQRQVAGFAFEYGYPEALDLAAEVLNNKSPDNEVARSEVRDLLARYTNARGDSTDASYVDWLASNRSTVRWNDRTRRFE